MGSEEDSMGKKEEERHLELILGEEVLREEVEWDWSKLPVNTWQRLFRQG